MSSSCEARRVEVSRFRACEIVHVIVGECFMFIEDRCSDVSRSLSERLRRSIELVYPRHYFLHELDCMALDD